MHRTLVRIGNAPPTPEGDGMTVHRAFPSQAIGRIDPFLMLDQMGPMEFAPGHDAGFPDHPHRGFETVTYMLEGEFEHRDSQGHAGRIGPGDVQWMTAGSGILHSEMPSKAIREKGGVLRGLQLWVNLPRASKMMAPRYQEIPAARIPVVKVPGGQVRILAGAFGSERAVIDTMTPIQYLHATLDAGAELELPVPAGHNGFVYVLSGSATVAGQLLKATQVAMLGTEGERLRVEAGKQGIDLILVSGVPLKEPVFQHGPFVMTSRDEIIQAVRDFQEGKFGTIPDSPREAYMPKRQT